MIAWIANLFVAESEPAHPPRDLSKFDLGVCPGCRGLRAVASARCVHCDSAAAVVADCAGAPPRCGSLPSSKTQVA